MLAFLITDFLDKTAVCTEIIFLSQLKKAIHKNNKTVNMYCGFTNINNIVRVNITDINMWQLLMRYGIMHPLHKAVNNYYFKYLF